MSEPLIHALHEPDAFAPISGDLTPVLLSQEMPGGMQPIQRQADARLVAYARGKLVAFAPHATQELIGNPQWMSVPGAAYYAYGLLFWQERHIPFIHLESMLLAYPAFDAAVAPSYALVLAYQNAPGEPLQYGVIAASDIPYGQPVSDADFSPLPTDSDMWVDLAISCFRHQDQDIPILDAARIFGRYHG